MKNAPLTEKLLGEAHRFDFFQAVRVLELMAAEQVANAGERLHPVGEDHAPRQEAVRFGVLPSHSFPAGEIVEVRPIKPPADGETKSAALEMIVAFLGLTGPNGVLPRHYTSLLIERVRAKDFTLCDFLDLFHHRTISLFYRAWEKYRFPIAYERLTRDKSVSKEDLFTECLYCLLGLGLNKLLGRMDFDDEAFLYYGGFFAHYPRNALSLECLLSDHFELPARVLQYCGQWLYLSPPDQSALPSADRPDGLNTQLGQNVVVGERVWDVEGKFRLRLGPLGFDDFQSFMPSGQSLRPLCQMIRAYAGVQFDFDVQPVLKAAEVPRCQLGGDSPVPARLGWNTWIFSGEIASDVSDAIFSQEVMSWTKST